jgi:hypothetical protein
MLYKRLPNGWQFDNLTLNRGFVSNDAEKEYVPTVAFHDGRV